MKGRYIFRLLAAVAGVLMLVSGCGKQIPETAPEDVPEIRIACVGDSITFGYGIEDPGQNSYPAVLQSLLGEGYRVRNFGVSGCSVQEDTDLPFTALESYTESIAFQPDILIFMMGGNDTRSGNWQGEEAFRSSLEALLDSYTGAQILLCTPAVTFFTESCPGPVYADFGVRPDITGTIADIVRDVARERACTLVDIYALTEEHPQWYCPDGVHPNAQGAAAIAEALREAVLALEP